VRAPGGKEIVLPAKKGFRRLKAHEQLAPPRIPLKTHYEKDSNNSDLAKKAKAA
jgi:hypothetical protein